MSPFVRALAPVLAGSALIFTFANCRCNKPGVVERWTGRDKSCVKDVLLGAVSSCFLVSAGYYLCRGDEAGGEFGEEPWPGIPEQYQYGKRDALEPYVGMSKRFAEIQIASRSCGRDDQKRLWCWGRNFNDIGADHHPIVTAPVEQKQFGRIDTFDAQGDVCAIRKGEVVCIGYGNDPRELSRIGSIPPDVTQIGLGVDFGCVANAHDIYCWGKNSWANDKGSPHLQSAEFEPWDGAVKVEAPAMNIKKLAVGSVHACVLSAAGRVYCFGSTEWGCWGTGVVAVCEEEHPCELNLRTAHEVRSLGSSVRELVVGGAVSCALKQDGSVWCWGSNDDRAVTSHRANKVLLERGSSTVPHTVEPLPLQVKELGIDNARLYGGGGHFCVRKHEGAIWCWGSNRASQIGYEKGKCSDDAHWCAPREMKIPCPKD